MASKVFKTTKFDMADFLGNGEDIASYLTDAFATGDRAYVSHALGVIARTKGMANVARKAGMGRESLYKALSAEGNPELGTVLRVMAALGLRLTASSARDLHTRKPRRRAA